MHSATAAIAAPSLGVAARRLTCGFRTAFKRSCKLCELIEIATERGRKVKKDLKLGICGEHGGDPASVFFCHKAGLDYVSCSPYRVPIARLAAAQAALGGPLKTE